MATAVALRAGFSAADLRQLAAASKNGNQSRLLLSLPAVRDGMKPDGGSQDRGNGPADAARLGAPV